MLEELKAAFNAATPGEWRLSGCKLKANSLIEHGDEETRSPIIVEVYSAEGRHPREANANFITLAHNLMPELLEAVNALHLIAGVSANGNSEPDEMDDALAEIQGIVHAALTKLKG